MITVSIPQVSKADKVIIKTSSKLKNDIKKSDSASTSSDSFSETVVKCTYQNCAFAKSDFTEWLRIPDCKLHRLMLWNPEENTKGQGLQKRLFKRDISFIIKILKGNIESKAKLLVNLTKIRKHYPSVYVMCQTLMSAINTEIPFTD